MKEHVEPVPPLSNGVSIVAPAVRGSCFGLAVVLFCCLLPFGFSASLTIIFRAALVPFPIAVIAGSAARYMGASASYTFGLAATTRLLLSLLLTCTMFSWTR